MASVYDLFKVVLGDYMKAITGHSLFAGVDPIVLDLNGNGLELTEQTTISPHFDMDSDGFAEPTGWVRPNDGFLAIDRNGNGTIDNASELFGTPTVSGFQALAALDSNGDAVIDGPWAYEEIRSACESKVAFR